MTENQFKMPDYPHFNKRTVNRDGGKTGNIFWVENCDKCGREIEDGEKVMRVDEKGTLVPMNTVCLKCGKQVKNAVNL